MLLPASSVVPYSHHAPFASNQQPIRPPPLWDTSASPTNAVHSTWPALTADANCSAVIWKASASFSERSTVQPSLEVTLNSASTVTSCILLSSSGTTASMPAMLTLTFTLYAFILAGFAKAMAAKQVWPAREASGYMQNTQEPASLLTSMPQPSPQDITSPATLYQKLLPGIAYTLPSELIAYTVASEAAMPMALSMAPVSISSSMEKPA